MSWSLKYAKAFTLHNRSQNYLPQEVKNRRDKNPQCKESTRCLIKLRNAVLTPSPNIVRTQRIPRLAYFSTLTSLPKKQDFVCPYTRLQIFIEEPTRNAHKSKLLQNKSKHFLETLHFAAILFNFYCGWLIAFRVTIMHQHHSSGIVFGEGTNSNRSSVRVIQKVNRTVG